MINHINEVTTRGDRSIAVAAEHPALRANVHDYLIVPDTERFLSPILATIPAQPVAYCLSVARGIEPDFSWESEQDPDGGLDDHLAA